MPVISEKSEGSRRGSRRWLVACGVLSGLLILLPLVPFVAPVTLRVGDRSLCANAVPVPGPPQPLRTYGADVPVFTVPSRGFGSPLVNAVDVHIRQAYFGRWHYHVWWFRRPKPGNP